MTEQGLRRGTQIAEMAELVEERVERIVVDCPFGSVTVRPSADSWTRIDAEVQCDEDEPLPTISWTVSGGELRVDVHGGTGSATGRGFVRMTISAPREASLVARTKVGAIDVTDRAGDVELRTSAGAATVRDIEGDVTMRSSAGALRARDVRGESVLLDTSAGAISAHGIDAQFVRIVTQLGRVRAALVTKPHVLEATTSVGKMEIAIPAGRFTGSANSRVRVGRGIELLPGTDSDHRLDVRVTLGSARIVAAGDAQ